MNKAPSNGERYIPLLSRLVLQGYRQGFSSQISDLERLGPELEQAALLSENDFCDLLELADAHHVSVRVLQVLEQLALQRDRKPLRDWCQTALAAEQARIGNALEWLFATVKALESSECPVSVIKSLDHWPDLGSDFDLYTSGAPEQVIRVMREKLQARLEPRSWGDRLASKWNFRIPGLPELVEVHVRYLGQTGEQDLMAARVLERSVNRTVKGHTFRVPSPEERILISTLQRMYRHFYFRLCDMVDTASLLASGCVDFAELRHGAELGGIWPGVASFLLIVAEYVKSYGYYIVLPDDVIGSAHNRHLKVRFRGNFLRVPIAPAAGLYGSQLWSAGLHRDLRAISRLPLLPPLAVSALLAFRLTGSDKGVW